MIMKKTILLLTSLCVLLVYCGKKAEKETATLAQPIDKNADSLVVYLYNNLLANAGKSVMFGHQDDLAYGVGWQYVDGNSGSYPAVYGWDIGGIENDSPLNLDSVPFDKMRQYMIDVFNRGGLNTVSWHLDNPITGKSSWDDTKDKNPTVGLIIPGGANHEGYKTFLDKVAFFLQSVKTDDGQNVPIVFRPFHENNGDWFWWGAKHSTPEEYKKLYQFTVEYLRDTKGLHNLLYAYSPDRLFDSDSSYLDRYPGDEYVDIIGVDDYYSFKSENPIEEVSKRLTIISQLAKQRNKVCAMTETGNEGVVDTTWFTRLLLPAIKSNENTQRIAWVLVWRNYDTKHHYAPYPGHPAVNDFIAFKQDSLIKFEDEITPLYK